MERKWAKDNQSEQQEQKRILKNEDCINSLWDNFSKFDFHITGVPVGEDKEQEIGNLFQKTMKENSPSLVKEIRHASPESTESQKRWIERFPLQDIT